MYRASHSWKIVGFELASDLLRWMERKTGFEPATLTLAR